MLVMNVSLFFETWFERCLKRFALYGTLNATPTELTSIVAMARNYSYKNGIRAGHWSAIIVLLGISVSLLLESLFAGTHYPKLLWGGIIFSPRLSYYWYEFLMLFFASGICSWLAVID